MRARGYAPHVRGDVIRGMVAGATRIAARDVVTYRGSMVDPRTSSATSCISDTLPHLAYGAGIAPVFEPPSAPNRRRLTPGGRS